MSTLQPKKGDIVRVSLVGRIEEVYENEGRETGYLLFVHCEEVPILASQVVELLGPSKEEQHAQ